jgi:DNA polymerase III subunit delta'
MLSIDPVQEAFESFQKTISSGRMAHAYVVVGPPRSEARSFVLKVLASLYNNGSGMTPNLEVHPDIMWIEPQKKSRIIGVDQIREVSQRLSQTSYSGGWKSCIIVGADRLGEEASNAFLKTLEEPAGQTIFFLLTDQPENLLPTIASRCQRIVLTNIHDNLPVECQLELISVMSAGGGETISGIVPAKRVGAILEAFKKKAADDIEAAQTDDDDDETIEARVGARYREARTAVMRFIMLWHRDVLLSAFGVDDGCLHNREFCKQIRQSATGLTPRRALQNVEVAETMKEQLDRNLDETSVLSIGFYHLVE